MFRFLRKAHRWMAPLFVLAVVAVMVTEPPQPATPFQMIQQVLMLLLMLSGIALFVYPFWARSRSKALKEQQKASQPEAE